MSKCPGGRFDRVKYVFPVEIVVDGKIYFLYGHSFFFWPFVESEQSERWALAFDSFENQIQQSNIDKPGDRLRRNPPEMVRLWGHFDKFPAFYRENREKSNNFSTPQKNILAQKCITTRSQYLNFSIR